MKPYLKAYASKFSALLGSRWAWFSIIGLFVVQAVWMALSMAYPGVFDEEVHLGTIQLYATQWSPWITSQPVGSEYLGQLAGQTSYLFYYLMSLIYRLLETVGLTQMGSVIVLRLLNVAMFTAGLVVGRRLLRQAGLSAAASNLALLVVVLIPVFPQLAGQINYDNPLFWLTNLFLLYGLKSLQSLMDGRFEWRLLLKLGIVGLLASVIKVAVLPILAAVLLVLGAYLALYAYRHHSSWLRRPDWRQIVSSLSWRDYLLIVGLLVALGLSGARYGSNYLNYGSLQPGCDQVISVERCLEFGPYGRDYAYSQRRSADFEPKPLEYLSGWYTGMHKRLLFTINGKTAVDTYVNYPPLPIVSAATHIIAAVGLVSVVWRLPSRFRSPTDKLLLAVVAIYILTLITRNYSSSYQSTGRLVAINGRYLLLVMLPAAAVVIKSVSELIGRRTWLKSLLASLVIIGFVQGGGISGYIVRSEPSWWWPQPIVETVQSSTKRVISPLLIGD